MAMNPRLIYSSLLISLTMGAALVVGRTLPNNPVVLQAHSAPPNNPAVLGLFSEAKKSNVVVDPTIRSGSTFRMDVNLTDAGSIKGFDINITYASAVLSVKNSSFTGSGCANCVFSLVSTTWSNAAGANFLRLAVLDTDSGTPFVNGNGILFRVSFNALSTTGAATVIHIESKSLIQNPSSVPYKSIDGYYDSRSSPSDFSITNNPATITIVRPVTSTNTGSTTISIPSTPVGLSSTIALLALSLPINATGLFSTNPCPLMSTCTSTLTITIHGGAAGRSGTTPSGTYSIPIIGNATASGVSGPVPFTIRVAWLRLIVQPPPAPVYNFAASPASFTQEAGNYTLVTLTAALSSGTNDLLSFGADCYPRFSGGTCNIKPQTGNFPLTATLNVSTSAVATQPNKTYRFNATATSLGTYSEVIVTKNITISATVLKTHDLDVKTVALSRNFAYEGVFLSAANALTANVTVKNQGTVSETFQVNATAKTVLTAHSTLKFVDANNNGVYVPGDVVVMDADGNGLYGSGKIDPNIRFVDSNGNGHWNNAESVIYDSDSDARFTFGKYHNDTVIVGTTPANNTALSFDPKLLFVDSNNNGSWQTGKTIFYDINGNGVYDGGEILIVGASPPPEPVLVGSPPPLGTVLSSRTLSFVDRNFNGVLDPGETIVFDSNGNGLYDTAEPIARGIAPSAGVLLGLQSITLQPNATMVVIMGWDPGSLSRGSYAVRAVASPVTGEFDLMNNAFLLSGFAQRLKGDVNGDCRVDILDVGGVTGVLGQVFGDPVFGARWKPEADLNNDGVINVLDLGIVTGYLGQKC